MDAEDNLMDDDWLLLYNCLKYDEDDLYLMRILIWQIKKKDTKYHCQSKSDTCDQGMIVTLCVWSKIVELIRRH